jgi:O-antigen/teichoic acid export membrane protein
LTEVQSDLSILASGTGIAIAGRLVGRILDLMRQAILTRLLTMSEFGVYALAITLFRMVLMISSLGLNTSLLRLGMAERDNPLRFRTLVRTGLGLSLLIGVIFGTLLFVLSPFIALQVFHEPLLEPVLYALAVAIPLSVFFRVSLAATTFSRRIAFSVSMEEIVQPGLTLVLLLVLVALFHTVSKMNAALIALAVSLAICSLIAVRRVFALFPELRGEIDHRIAPVAGRMLRFGMPLAFASFFLWSSPLIDRLIIGYFVTSEDAGIYIVVAQLATFFTLIAAAIETIQSPLVAGLIHLNDLPRLERLVQSAVRLGLLIGLPALMVVLAEGRTLLELIFGADFGSGRNAFLILSAASLLRVISDRAIALLVMAGHNRQWLTYTTIVFLINIVLDLLLIPIFGTVGAALSTAIVNVFLLIALAFTIWKRVRVRLMSMSIVWFIPAGLVGMSVGSVPQWLGLPMSPLVRMVLFSILSFITLLVFSWLFILNKEEQALLSQVFRRLSLKRS